MIQVEIDVRELLLSLIENQPTCPEAVLVEFLHDTIQIPASLFEAAMLDLASRDLIVRQGGQVSVSNAAPVVESAPVARENMN